MYDHDHECTDPHERSPRLREANRKGSIPSIYDYGLTCDAPNQRRHWLMMAAQEGNLRAAYLLDIVAFRFAQERHFRGAKGDNLHSKLSP